MTLAHLLLVSVIQGITEFLPVSSSAHLALIPSATGWVDQGLNIDIAAHIGSLGAVILYLRQDLVLLVKGASKALTMEANQDSKLLLILLVASAPAIAAGALLVQMDANLFRSIEVIAWATLIGAIALLLADNFTLQLRNINDMTFKHALLIGCIQILALIPGASRAGVTITGSLLCGYTRNEAARFSMLLSIPVILAAAGFNAVQIINEGEVALTKSAVVTVFLAFLTSYVTISVMMTWLRRASYTPFIIYRLGLGLLLLWWIYSGSASI